MKPYSNNPFVPEWLRSQQRGGIGTDVQEADIPSQPYSGPAFNPDGSIYVDGEQPRMPAYTAFGTMPEHLRSEKDTSPYWETEQHGFALPISKSGYTGKTTMPDWLAGMANAVRAPFGKGPVDYDPGYGIPSIAGSSGIPTFARTIDAAAGGPGMTQDEVENGAKGAADFMFMGGMAGNIANKVVRGGAINPGVASMFAGPLAKTADQAALAKAQAAEASGVPRESIWQDHGWFKGVDGKWRFEIDDSGAKLLDPYAPENWPRHAAAQVPQTPNPSYVPQSLTLDDYMSHPDLARAYWPTREQEPSVVYDNFTGGTRGKYSPGINMISIDQGQLLAKDYGRSTALHELQHAIQEKEGFARGTNPEAVEPIIAEARYMQPERRAKMELFQNQADAEAAMILRDPLRADFVAEAVAKYPPTEGPFGITKQMAVSQALLDADGIYARLAKKYNQDYHLPRMTPHDLYKNFAGEAEARLAQKRADLTADQRRARPPWLDYDVPEAQQIVRGVDGTAYSNAKPAAGVTAASHLARDANGNLPMDLASRMQRAKEMGFDVDEKFFHGTGNASNFANGFDPKLSGLGNDQIGSGFYFTNDPNTASSYANRTLAPGMPKLGGETAPGVIPAFLKMKKPIQVTGADANLNGVTMTAAQANDILSKSPLLKGSLDDNPLGNWHDIWSDGVQPWMLRDVAKNYEGPNLLSLENDFFKGASGDFRSALRDVLGYDGVVQKFPNGETHKVAWFPEQVRSPNAAFDPEQSMSANLLAANAKPAAGVTALNHLSRDVDGLGYYSAALEAAKGLPQAKGTPQQMLSQILKTPGVKQAEIEATGLGNAFADRPSVTRDEIVKHLTDNRVGVNEQLYTDRSVNEGPDAYAFDGTKPAKWQRHSLDPSNPSYRETMLSLPERAKISREDYIRKYREGNPGSSQADDDIARGWEVGQLLPGERPQDVFRSGHFSEPNIIGHMMTSLNKYEGKPVYTLDQIQSDWGQKLRDGGVRDEAKIAELNDRLNTSKADYNALMLDAHSRFKETTLPGNLPSITAALNSAAKSSDSNVAQNAKELLAKLDNVAGKLRLLVAERATAEAATPGHPLVNTTDQWTNTTLRRGLQQAIDANADYMAIPSGKTVLSYNPGDTHGMTEFYDKIVPKNLQNILAKLDAAGIKRQFVPQLETPSGLKGDGFTTFEITPAMREAARKGLPLFSNPLPLAGLPALQNAFEERR